MDTILFDSHIHFQEMLLLKQSKADYFACCGIEPDDWQKVKELSQKQKNITPFYGLHPWFVDSCQDDWQKKLEAVVRGSLCGIGETGLDSIKEVSLAKQIDAFVFHLKLAQKYQRPVVIHMVKAYGEVLRILREYPLENGFMIHAYSGSKEMVADLVKLGAYFSLGGFFIKKDLTKQEEILKAIPKDRLLIETDSPSKDNLKIEDVAAKIAYVLDLSFEKLAMQTSNNAFKFLGKIK